MATMYCRKSRLSVRQQNKLIENFVAGVTARAAAELMGIQPNTTIKFFMHLRQLIASKLPGYELSGEVEADEKLLRRSPQRQTRSRSGWQGGCFRSF